MKPWRQREKFEGEVVRPPSSNTKSSNAQRKKGPTNKAMERHKKKLAAMMLAGSLKWDF